MLGHHRQVIFKEDMFGVIENAHKNNDRHRGYKGTFNKVCLPDFLDLDWHIGLVEFIQYTVKCKNWR